MNSLSKNQALRLIPDVVDGEASEQEEAAFLDYIKRDPEVEKRYQNTLMVKRLLSEKLPKHPAPDHLRDNVLQLIKEEIKAEQYQDQPVQTDITDAPKAHKKVWRPVLFNSLRYMAAAAVILFITLMLVELLDRSTGIVNTETFVVENLSAQHFADANGAIMEPHFTTAHPGDAEEHLRSHLGYQMTIPEVEGASFAGIVITDFYNGMQTPLFEYVQEEIDENIYIFAFRVNELEGVNSIRRDENAVKSCSTKTDYFVNDIHGTHVVSWRWNNNWYSAVSNHDGHDLAALIKPLRNN